MADLNSIGEILGIAAGISAAVERSVEYIKMGYLKLKKAVSPKSDCSDVSVNEKRVLTLLTSLVFVLLGGPSLLLQIPGIINLAHPFQVIITTLILSLGSGVLHTLYEMFRGIKANIESANRIPS